MFTKLPIPQRLQVGLILTIAFLLVLGSNLLDQRNFDTVKNTVNSVYKDRVVVQGFIYQLNKIFHNKELVLVQQQGLKPNHVQNQEIKEILDDFRATELTLTESNLLSELNKTFVSLMETEKSEIENPNAENLELTRNKLNKIQNRLDGLAEIQLNESEQLTQISNKSLDMNTLMSKLEIGFLILIGILLMVLIVTPGRNSRTNNID